MLGHQRAKTPWTRLQGQRKAVQEEEWMRVEETENDEKE